MGEEKERGGGEQEVVGLERRKKDGGSGRFRRERGFIDNKQDSNVDLGGGGGDLRPYRLGCLLLCV